MRLLQSGGPRNPAGASWGSQIRRPAAGLPRAGRRPRDSRPFGRHSDRGPPATRFLLDETRATKVIFRPSTPFRFLAAFCRTAWAKVAGYNVLASVEESDDRLQKCHSCEELVDGSQCRVCTCFVGVKTELALEQCPKRKWLRIWRKKTTPKS